MCCDLILSLFAVLQVHKTIFTDLMCFLPSLMWWQHTSWPVKTFAYCLFECVLEEDWKNDIILMLNHETVGHKPAVFSLLTITPASWVPSKLFHSSLDENLPRSFWGTKVFITVLVVRFCPAVLWHIPLLQGAWWMQEGNAEHLWSNGCILQQDFAPVAEPWTASPNTQIK